jgi:ABC-type multidrug transport system fused ATPase/permease subunit
VGRLGASSFSVFGDVAMHVIQRRLMTWMLVLLAPAAAIILDICGKVYSNIYYPSQTQIHIEIQAQERKVTALSKKEATASENFGEDAV